MSDQTNALIPRKTGFVQIAGSLDELAQHFELYQKVKSKLLTKDDLEDIKGHQFIKKTGWVKLAVAFNLSTRVIEERKEADPQEPSKFAYHFTVECRADNGRVVQEVGTCDNTEKDEDEHIIRAMAKTRATSRALSAMIGAGEVSAEEMTSAKTQGTNFCKCPEATKQANPMSTDKRCPVCTKLRAMP